MWHETQMGEHPTSLQSERDMKHGWGNPQPASNQNVKQNTWGNTQLASNQNVKQNTDEETLN